MIRELAQGVSKRIKAQQYIQSTYTLVKELVENAIDAGASAVKVRIDECITVEDDGCGIEELEKVGIAGHTSKEQMSYYVLGCTDTDGCLHGFRGQALSSIADLCDLEIVSRAGERAFKRVFSSGAVEECARERGTTVRIAGLFRNCPVRRRINENSIKKDLARICMLVDAYRCVNRIHFSVFHNRKLVLNCSGHGGPAEYLAAEYPEHAQNCLVASNDLAELRMLPVAHRDARQMVFLGRRPVSSRRMLGAIKAEFGLYASGAPTFVLVIRGRGDVNVSVDKTEVILPDEDAIVAFLRSEISRFFSSEIHLDPPSRRTVPVDAMPSPARETSRMHVASAKAPETRMQRTEPREIEVLEIRETSVVPAEADSEESGELAPRVPDMPAESAGESFSRGAYSLFEHDEFVQPRISFSKEDFVRLRIVGQFNNGFIIAQLEREGRAYLVAVDQHAADEIRNFEAIRKTFLLKKQRTIVPVRLDLTPVEEMVVADNLELFSRHGFTVRNGMLETVPVYKNQVFGAKEFRELLDEARNEEREFGRVRDIVASKACRTSIMIGDALSMNEMRRVVASLAVLDAPWRCPHGRPTFMVLCESAET